MMYMLDLSVSKLKITMSNTFIVEKVDNMKEQEGNFKREWKMSKVEMQGILASCCCYNKVPQELEARALLSYGAGDPIQKG
jgi:hypothetical protein